VATGDVNDDDVGDVLLGTPQFTGGAPGYAAIFFGGGAEAPDLALTLTPREPPIVIPPGGGSFRYDLDLTNQSDAARTVDVWIVLSGPGTNRTLVRVTRTLGPGASLRRTFTQSIRGGLPPGVYTVTANAGTFPVAEVTDSFLLEKQ
jgi:hypothetical protein